MAAERTRLVRDLYQRRLRALRMAVQLRLGVVYQQVTRPPGATPLEQAPIDPMFVDLSARAGPLIEAGQASALVLSAGYLRSLFSAQTGTAIEPGPTPEGLVGVTAQGLPLIAGMAAFPSMVKAHIVSGHSVPEALDFGRYLATRFADREIIRTADDSTDRMARQTREVIGWRGHVHPDSCDECKANEGEHGLDIDFYRHGSCRCEREWIVRVNS